MTTTDSTLNITGTFIVSGAPGWEVSEEMFQELLKEEHEYNVLLVCHRNRYFILDRSLLRVKVMNL